MKRSLFALIAMAIILLGACPGPVTTDPVTINSVTPDPGTTDPITTDPVTTDPLVHIRYRELVDVPGGTFIQTSTESGYPSFSHTIDAFRMAKYQVTYELWYTVRQWAIQNGYSFANRGREGSRGIVGAEPSAGNAKYEPVTSLNWRDCIVWCNAYSEMEGLSPCYENASGDVLRDSAKGTDCDAAVCKWGANGYRLPSEGQWQFAASYKNGTDWTLYDYASGATKNFQNREECKRVAWYYENSNYPDPGIRKTQAVGGKAANHLGVFDMSGNVSEWCYDRFGKYPTSSKSNYTGPADGGSRILRGGNWDGLESNTLYDSMLQVGQRALWSTSALDNYSNSKGFRVSRAAN